MLRIKPIAVDETVLVSPQNASQRFLTDGYEVLVIEVVSARYEKHSSLLFCVIYRTIQFVQTIRITGNGGSRGGNGNGKGNDRVHR